MIVFHKGDRVRLNAQGMKYSPGFNGRTGVVYYRPMEGAREVAVLWHGNKKPTYYDTKLIEKVEEAQ